MDNTGTLISSFIGYNIACMEAKDIHAIFAYMFKEMEQKLAPAHATISVASNRNHSIEGSMSQCPSTIRYCKTS